MRVRSIIAPGDDLHLGATDLYESTTDSELALVRVVEVHEEVEWSMTRCPNVEQRDPELAVQSIGHLPRRWSIAPLCDPEEDRLSLQLGRLECHRWCRDDDRRTLRRPLEREARHIGHVGGWYGMGWWWVGWRQSCLVRQWRELEAGVYVTVVWGGEAALDGFGVLCSPIGAAAMAEEMAATPASKAAGWISAVSNLMILGEAPKASPGHEFLIARDPERRSNSGG